MRTKEEYLSHKKRIKEQEFVPRKNCDTCGFSSRTCYCSLVEPFDCNIVFAILIHKLEIKRKIATGTMSHLVLKNSYLLPGYDYSNDSTVNELISNPKNYCVVLYPGDNSLNLSRATIESKRTFVPKGKKLVVFVIDGTWRTARQTMRISHNLSPLPRISFETDTPSNFRVRKQPSKECTSTVEAIHKTIELLGESQGFDLNSRRHDNLLEVFEYIVNNQISLGAPLNA